MGSSPIVPTKPSIAYLCFGRFLLYLRCLPPLSLALARPLPSSPLPSPPSPLFSLSSSFASSAFVPCSVCLRPLFPLPSPRVASALPPCCARGQFGVNVGGINRHPASAFAPCSALVLFGVLFVAIYRDAPRSSPSPPPSAQFFRNISFFFLHFARKKP